MAKATLAGKTFSGDISIQFLNGTAFDQIKRVTEQDGMILIVETSGKSILVVPWSAVRNISITK